MKNLIVKTAVKTFLIILCAAVLIFGIVSFACPQHMATFAEQIGNYGIALRYASLRYTYTDDTGDLARCVEDAILAGDDSSVIKYGDEFFEKEDCEQVALELYIDTNIDYYGLFSSELVKAYYATGEFGHALELAEDFNDGTDAFEYGCPLMSLAISVISGGDGENAGAMIESLQQLSPSDETQIQYLNDVIERLQAL